MNEAKQAIERTFQFMGIEGTRLPGTEGVDIDEILEAVYPPIRREVLYEVLETLDKFQRGDTNHHYLDPKGFIMKELVENK